MKKNLILYILIISLFSACGIFKNNIFTKKSKQLSVENLIDSLNNNYLEYNTLYYKFSSNISNNNQNLSFSGNLKIQKDSIILISVAPIGFEIGRAALTKDSILIINKIQNQYFKDDYDYFLLKYKIFSNYQILQDALTNYLFYYSDSLQNFKDVDLNIIDSNYVLNQIYSNNLNTYNQKTYINSQYYFIQKILINQINTEKVLEVNYSDFESINNTLFPLKINISYNDEKINYKIEFNISKVLLNKELKFNSEIPENYVKVWY